MALKVEWKDTSHSQRAEVGLLGYLSAYWDPCRPRGSSEPPWAIAVLGHCMKKRYASQDEAKAAAERVAEKLIREAAALLSE